MNIHNHSNASLLEATNIEDYSMYVKAGFVIVSVIFVVFSVVALYALNKTRHTPKTARFLSSGLITYDILTVTFYTVRKCIENYEVNLITQITGVYFNFLAYITVGVMSLERLIIFYSPNFYIRHMNARRVRLYVSLLWLTMTITYFYVRFGACYISHRNMTLYDVAGECNNVSFLFYGVSVFAVIVVSIVCYIKIFQIVSKRHNLGKSHSISATAKLFQNYKSTSLVFVYLMTIILTSLAYAIIIFLHLDTVHLRLSIDVVNMTNCMMDPCVYVLWYSECRMEIMKMLSVCVPSLTSRIEKMRIKIYNIVTSENRSNKVHPGVL